MLLDGKLRSPRTEGLAGYDKVMGRTSLGSTLVRSGIEDVSKGLRASRTGLKLSCWLRSSTGSTGPSTSGSFKLPEKVEQLEVLVIAPYKAQVEDLRRRLAPKSFRHLAPTVMSVDAVQGQRVRPRVALADSEQPQGRLGFLGADYWRRINVALSRARFGLTIIGDAGFIRGTNGSLRTVLEYIEQHPADCGVRLADDD